MKPYQLVGLNTAINLLRPGAKWEWTGGVGFTIWDDPRPQPSEQEIYDTIDKIREFEESINTILLPEQKKALERQLDEIESRL
jgi:hypothetical protein